MVLNMLRWTNIVAALGPSLNTPQAMEELVFAVVDVVRI